VVLIGHSQGAGLLVNLIKNEIDPNPDLRARLVSAILLGCAISYASFRASAPPPANNLFGRSQRPGWKAACTNPASLRDSKGWLHPFLPTDGAS